MGDMTQLEDWERELLAGGHQPERRVQDMTDDELIAHIGLPPSSHPVTAARNANAVREVRASVGEPVPAGRQPARRATPEQMDAQRRRSLSALHPRDPRNAAVRSVRGAGGTVTAEDLDIPEHDETLHLDGRTRTIDTSSDADRRERWSVRGMSKQFEGVGQPAQIPGGEFFRSHRDGYSEESVSFGWRNRTADPSKVPFHPHAHPDDHQSESAAYVSMGRRLDSHYALSDADTNDWYEEREDGHHQGVLLESEKAKPWKVSEMYSTKDSRHMSNVLLGLAAEHSLKTSGKFPAASNDLSKHSTRVVHKLADAGVIEAPKNEHRNNIDWNHGAGSATSNVDYMARGVDKGYGGDERLSLEQGMHGGRVMRQVIKGARSTPIDRGLPEPQPLVNARSEAGRFQEFKHHQELQQKYDKPKSTVSEHQGTLF